MAERGAHYFIDAFVSARTLRLTPRALRFFDDLLNGLNNPQGAMQGGTQGVRFASYTTGLRKMTFRAATYDRPAAGRARVAVYSKQAQRARIARY